MHASHLSVKATLGCLHSHRHKLWVSLSKFVTQQHAVPVFFLGITFNSQTGSVSIDIHHHHGCAALHGRPQICVKGRMSAPSSAEALEVAFEINKILDCGLDREILSLCIALVETGVNPEALAEVIKKLRKVAAGSAKLAASQALPAPQ